MSEEKYVEMLEDGTLYDYITNLQEKLKVSQATEETYRLEMQDITKILGLDEYTTFDEVKEYATNLQEENNNLQRQIKIMEKYFELIMDIGFDYDGYNKAENLKSLIDDLVKLASLGRAANDTELMYIDNQEKHYNILNEEIKGEDK